MRIILDDAAEVPTNLQEDQNGSRNQSEHIIKGNYKKYSLIDIEMKINYYFKNRNYLIEAFTHHSRRSKAVKNHDRYIDKHLILLTLALFID